MERTTHHRTKCMRSKGRQGTNGSKCQAIRKWTLSSVLRSCSVSHSRSVSRQMWTGNWRLETGAIGMIRMRNALYLTSSRDCRERARGRFWGKALSNDPHPSGQEQSDLSPLSGSQLHFHHHPTSLALLCLPCSGHGEEMLKRTRQKTAVS